MKLERLPLRIRPAPHEPAYGILNRLALRHGFDTVRQFIAHLPIAPRAFAIEVLHGHALPELAALSGIDEATIRVSTLTFGESGLERLRSDGEFKLGNRNLRSCGRVCCSCLREDVLERPGAEMSRPHRRVWWDWPDIDVCPAHRLLLLKECPICKATLTTHLLSPRYCQCGFDLATLDGPQVDVSDVAACDYLVQRVISAKSEPAGPLDQMTIDNAAIAILQVGRAALFGSKTPSPETWRSLPRERIRVASAGLNAFREWPGRFHAILDGMVSNRRDVAVTKVATYYGTLQGWLKKKTTGSEFDPIRLAIADHSDRNFAQTSDRGLFGTRGLARSKITVGAAARRLHVSVVVMLKVIRYLQVEICGVEGTGKSQWIRVRTQTFSIDDLARIEAWIASRINQDEAVAMLAISKRAFGKLVETGLINTPEAPRSRLKLLYDRAEVQNLLSSAAGDAPVIGSVPDGCRDLVKSAQCSRNMSCWIRKLRDGQITAAGILEGAKGLRAILVRITDSAHLVSERSNDLLTRTEASRFLGLKSATTIGQAFARRLILPVEAPDQKKTRPLISKSDVLRFSEQYVTLAELHRDGRASASHQRVWAALTKAGVEPVFSGSADGCLYRRAEAERALVGVGLWQRGRTRARGASINASAYEQ